MARRRRVDAPVRHNRELFAIKATALLLGVVTYLVPGTASAAPQRDVLGRLTALSSEHGAARVSHEDSLVVLVRIIIYTVVQLHTKHRRSMCVHTWQVPRLHVLHTRIDRCRDRRHTVLVAPTGDRARGEGTSDNVDAGRNSSRGGEKDCGELLEHRNGL